MDDTMQNNKSDEEVTGDQEVLDPSLAAPADDDATDENPAEDAEEDVEEPVLGLGDDDADDKPTDEEVAEKADEKSKDEGCEFC